jgi:hypothetical protein
MYVLLLVLQAIIHNPEEGGGHLHTNIKIPHLLIYPIGIHLPI